MTSDPSAGRSPHPCTSDSGAWAATWGTTPAAVPPADRWTVRDATLRQIVRVSIGGRRVRLRLTNAEGRAPLRIGAARLFVVPAPGVPASSAPSATLTFAGEPGILLAPNATAASDAVELVVPALSQMAILLHLPDRSELSTATGTSCALTAVMSGDHTGRLDVPPELLVERYALLAGLDVADRAGSAAAPAEGVVVAFGDSITAGHGTTTGADLRWPDLLAQRLYRAGRRIGVVNAGISGNRLLHDPAYADTVSFGRAGLTRFAADALAVPGVSDVVVLLGINDLIHPGDCAPASERVDADDLIAGYRQLIAAGHAAGVRVHGATLLPCDDGQVLPVDAELERQRVNAWIRSCGEWDTVIDTEAATADPLRPHRLRSAYDSGDGLHPGDEGMRAIASAMPLDAFARGA